MRTPNLAVARPSLFAVALLLILGGGSAAHAQLRSQTDLADIDRTFVCPENLPSDEARQNALEVFLERVGAAEKSVTIREVVGYRMTLLRKHQCYQTLRNIAELGGTGTADGQSVGGARIDVGVTKRFYGYLAAGDGERASALIIPEKRYSGPLSAGALTRYYAPMRVPLNLQLVELAPDGSVGVRYAYQLNSGQWCNGSANLYMTSRGADRLIGRIDAHHGC